MHPILIVLCFAVSAQAAFDVAKIRELIDKHSKCNGEEVPFKPTMITNLIAGVPFCLDQVDEYCFYACVAHHSSGMMKQDKFSMAFARQEAKGVHFQKKVNEKTVENFLAETEKCINKTPPQPSPTSGQGSCPAFKAFYNCNEEVFKKVCKKKVEDFLDDDE